MIYEVAEVIRGALVALERGAGLGRVAQDEREAAALGRPDQGIGYAVGSGVFIGGVV